MKMPEWIRNAAVYQIYPQSFMDTNGDGIGDLPGVISKLDYIRSLNVDAIWLNPCFVSPFQDAGYDVADYRCVAPRYGTNDDLKRLFEEAHKRGIHVLLDLVAAVNPSGKAVSASFAFENSENCETVLTALGVKLTASPGATRLDMPPVSFAVYRRGK